MHRIPLISSAAALRGKIEAAAGLSRSGEARFVPLHSRDHALEYLATEMPDLVLVHFPDDELGAFNLLESITGDPWLNHGGIIALCDDDESVERLESARGMNLIVALQPENLECQLPRVLDIVHANQRILFQRELGASLVREISGCFKLANDPLEAHCYTNLICNFLFNANRIDTESRDALALALFELLINAIEHGNCGISHEEKTEWLSRKGKMPELIAKRCRNPEISSRRVTFEYAITSDGSRFLIADEGEGFDWREAADSTNTENLLKAHGRGILMSRAVTRNLQYNERGNEVSFELQHRTDEASTTPGLFEGLYPRVFRPDEYVFRENEPGNSLYYIAKGRFDVLVEESVVAQLSPDDLFLGEMSFLLGNGRNASVRAATPGRLIGISKQDFVRAIKHRPHYALLLSRLLAQRLERTNQRFRS